MGLTRSKALKCGTKGLKRSGFKRRGQGLCKGLEGSTGRHITEDEHFVEQSEDRYAARAARQMASARETRTLIQHVGLHALVSSDKPCAQSIQKDDAVRHDGYRRLVASMDCMWCGRKGRSNHAHENEGKGKGLKLDDRRAMPLCVDDMGASGCHTAFDQYALIDGGREAHIELGRRMAAMTRKIIFDMGKWPKDLPVWSEEL